MRSHFFAYLARMRFIQRWALMRNTSPENVQEHSHQVAVLAHALAVIRNEKFGGNVDAGAVAVAALYHDATEILTGDMPTPIKYYNPEIRDAYKAVEAVAGDKLLSLLPREFQETYRPILQPRDETVERALAWLKDQMQPDGTFLAYGEPSAESCAQVLLALAALGIDPEQEFGSVNPETGLAEFRKADGSYAHLLTDTEGNLMATEQAMLALCALERLPDGGCVYESKYREAA